jgi:uncharacterized protein YndB with AHSA1/START domain
MNAQISIVGNRLQVTRTFRFPRDRVFRWWSSAEKLQQWSGCKEASRCEIKMDFRVGGSFSQKMQIAGAGEFTISGRYDEILEPEKIVYHATSGPVTTVVTVEFIERDGGTQVVITHEGCPSEGFSKNVSQGLAETLEALELRLSDRSYWKGS